MANQEIPRKHVVVCYGSLRRGKHNHNPFLRQAKFIGEGKTTASAYTMRSMGAFPAVLKNGNTAIAVELYEVDDPTLARLDQLEGHPRWYQRELVQTSVGEGWMYMMDNDMKYETLPVVKSGDWNEYHQD